MNFSIPNIRIPGSGGGGAGGSNAGGGGAGGANAPTPSAYAQLFGIEIRLTALEQRVRALEAKVSEHDSAIDTLRRQMSALMSQQGQPRQPYPQRPDPVSTVGGA